MGKAAQACRGYKSDTGAGGEDNREARNRPSPTALSRHPTLRRFGISKAAFEIEHKNITTTKQFYDHTRLLDDEYPESVGTALVRR